MLKKPKTPPSAGETSARVDDEMVAINEALILSSVRQHELTEAAEALNARLEEEITERKRAENKVRVSEVRYRRFFEAASDGILLVDPVSGKITDANPYMTRLSGCPHDQLVGRQLWKTGWFGNREASRQLLARLKKILEVRFEQLTLDHCDGRRQMVEVLANLYNENGHSVIQCNFRDITERKNAEREQRRIDVLTASNVTLKQEIVQRQAVEEALHQTQQEQVRLLAQSQKQEESLRNLSYRMLQVQEEERKRISRELHDIISQTLIGINISITILAKGDPAGLPSNFQRKIAKTQRIVEEAVDRIHQFALELRPAMLDDLGLIPALNSFLEGFMKETGIHSSLSVFAGIEQANDETRTALFRVAQEALANVALHSRASHVTVRITSLDGAIQMEIRDDGKGYDVAGGSSSGRKNRLGLIGMKERIEMVGGRFHVESVPGQGTTVRVVIPDLDP